MNPYKIMKYTGAVMVLAAITVLLVSLGVASKSGDIGKATFGAVFFFVFGVIGAFFAKVGVECLKKEVRLIEKGQKFTGKICGHTYDGTATINILPRVLATVRYFDGDNIMEAHANTASTNPAAFPIGATVTISVYDGAATVIPKTVSNEHIEGEEELLAG